MIRKPKYVKLRAGKRFAVSLDSAAKRLGITKPHLYRVLVGERVSHSLTARYQQLVQELKGGAA